MNNMKSIARINMNKLYPASYYAPPAISPLMIGVGGRVGLAQQNNLAMYNYTIKQMAMSPFSVNSQEYMKRIREEYGYTDNGMYDAMGVIGAVVGSGVGAYLGAGGGQSIIKSSKDFNVFKPSTYKNLEFQSPIKNPKDVFTREGFSSKQQQTSATFREPEKAEFNKFIKDNETLIDKYNKAVNTRASIVKAGEKFGDEYKLYKDFTANIDELTKQLTEVQTKAKTLDNLKEQARLTDLINQYTEQRKLLNIDDDSYKAYLKHLDELGGADKTVANAATDIIKKTDGLSTDALKYVDDAISTVKPLSKLASSFMSYAGTAMDITSAGLNIAGATQAFQDNQFLVGSLYTFGALNDMASVAGDIVASIPTPVTAVVGQVLNIVGTVMSMASDAIIGALVGTTVGHSLTPEGAKAQQLYAENLYSSIVQRPISSLATVLTMFGTPAALNSLSNLNTSKVGVLNVIGKVSDALTNKAWGNYARASLNMMAVSGVQNIVAPIEEKIFEAPEDAEDVNFVTAFSLVGDLNDNLFGATARKATLIGLAKGDASAQTDALARAWGFSNTDTYYSPMFDDVRQALGWDLSPIGNSLFSTIGEILIDPQNLSEIAVEVQLTKTVDRSAYTTAAMLNVERAKILSGEQADPSIARVLFQHDTDGNILKTAYRQKTETGYKYITEEESKILKSNQYETINVSKVGNRYYTYEYITNSIGDKIEVQRHIDMSDEVYNNYNYTTTRFGKQTRKGMEQELQKYLRRYITQGDEGLSEVYIDSLSVIKGSSSKLIQGRDTSFVPALKTFIDRALRSDYNIDVNTLRNNINNKSPEEREKYIKDTLSIYSYYAQQNGDTTQLLNKLFTDFNVVLSSDQLRSLYYTHSGFREQMDLIQNVMGTINKMANPVAWVINSGLMNITNFLNKQASNIKEEKRMKLIIDLDEAFNNPDIIKQSELEERIKRISEKFDHTIDYQEIEKELIEAYKNDLQDADSEIVHIITEHENAVEAIKTLKDEADKYKEQIDQTSLKSWEVVTDKSTVYVEIKDDKDAKEIYNKIVDLEKKEGHRTHKENQELKEYRRAYFFYKYRKGVPQHLNYICSELSTHIALLDTYSLNANKQLLSIIKKVNKFSQLYNDTYIKETKRKDGTIRKQEVHHTNATRAKIFNEEFDNIYKIFTELGLDVSIFDDTGKLTYDQAITLIRKDPNWYGNLRIQRKLEFNDAVKIVLNDYIQQALQSSNMHALEIIGMSDLINNWVCNGGIKFWNEYTGDKTKLVQALMLSIAKRYKGTSVENVYKELSLFEHASEIVNRIEGYIKKADNKGSIIIDRAIEEVSPSFLRAIAFEKLYKENEQDINDIMKSLRMVSKYVDKVHNFIEDSDQEIFKHYLESYVRSFATAMQNTTMYEFIQSYFRMYHPDEQYALTLDKEVFEGIPLVSNAKMKEWEKEGKLSENLRTIINITAEHVEHYTSEEEYNTTQRVINYNATLPIKEIVADQEKVNVLLTEDGTEVTEDNVVETEQRTFAPEGAKQEFINRVESQEQTTEMLKETSEEVEQIFPHINKVERNISFTYKHRGKEDKSYYIKTLVNPAKANAIIFNGTMFINIKPVTLVDEEGKKILYSKLGIKEYGYTETIERVIEKILNELDNDKSSIKAIYIGNKRYLTNTKGVSRPHVIKELVKAYKDNKLSIAYNNTYTRGTVKGTTISKTTRYFTVKLRAEFNKRLHIDINNRKAVGFDFTKYCTYDINKDEYTINKDGIQAYIDDMYKNPTANEQAIKYLEELYDQAYSKVEENLAYDRGVIANSYIRSWEQTLRQYELLTFAGSNPTSATVSSDIIAKVLSKDAYFRDEIEALTKLPDLFKNGELAPTVFTRTLLRIHDHITVSTRTPRKLDTKQFVAIDYVRTPDADDTGEYYFKISDSKKISLTSLLLDYKLSKNEVIGIIKDVHSKTADSKYIDMRAAIDTRYNRLLETAKIYNESVQDITEDEYVVMVKSLDASKDEQEIRRAYNILRTHWDEQETVSQFHLKDVTKTEEVYNIFKQAEEDFNNAKEIEYNGTTYKVGVDASEDTIANFDVYLLISILKSTIDKKDKFNLLKDVFFYDYKTAKGVGGKQNIEDTKAELKDCEEYIQNLEKQIRAKLDDPTLDYDVIQMQEALKRANTYKARLMGALSYFTEVSDKFKNYKSKEMFITQVLNNVIPFKELQYIFYNYTHVSDTSKYLPAFTEDGQVIIVKKEYATVNKKGKGAGPLNTQIIGYFRHELENNRTFKKVTVDNVEYDAWTKTEHASNKRILIKLPKDSTLSNKEIEELKIKLQETYKTVFILTDETYNEIVTMMDSGVIKTYFTYDAFKKDNYDTYAGQINTQLNVKGSKVRTPAFIHDMYLIKDYLEHGTYQRLRDYLSVEDYIKFYKGFGTDNRFSTSSTLIKLVQAAKSTKAFFEFIDAFRNEDGDVPYNLNALADYFTNDAIKYKKYSKETTTWRELEQETINGRKGTEVLEEIIDELYNRYKDSDVDFNTDKVLNTHDMLDVMENLYRLTIEYTKQDAAYLKQAERLIGIYKKSQNIEVENIRDKQLKESFDTHEALYKQFRAFATSKINARVQGERAGRGTNSIAYKFVERNLPHINKTYNELKARHASQVYNYSHSHVNLKTMYHIIPVFEELMSKIKQGNNITDKEFSVIQTLWDSVQLDAPANLVQNILGLIKNNKSLATDEEVYTYFFKEIMYPLVQNITLDFNRSSGMSLFMQMQNDMPSGLSLADAVYTRQEAVEVNKHIIKLRAEVSKYDNDPNGIPDSKLLKLLEDAKSEVGKLITTYTKTKEKYGINLEPYTNTIIDAVNKIYFDDAIAEIKLAISENREADPFLAFLYQNDVNNEPYLGTSLNTILSLELPGVLNIDEAAKKIEREYERIENKKTRNYKITPEVHFKKYNYKSDVNLKRSSVLIYEDGKLRDEQNADTFAKFLNKEIGISETDANTLISKLAYSLTKEQDFTEPATTKEIDFEDASTFAMLDLKVMEDDKDYIDKLKTILKQRNPNKTESEIEDLVKELYTNWLHYEQQIKRDWYRASHGDTEAHRKAVQTFIDLRKFSKDLNLSNKEITEINDHIGRHWMSKKSYENTYYEIVYSIKHDRHITEQEKLPELKKDIIYLYDTNILQYDKDFFSFFTKLFNKQGLEEVLNSLPKDTKDTIKLALSAVSTNLKYLNICNAKQLLDQKKVLRTFLQSLRYDQYYLDRDYNTERIKLVTLMMLINEVKDLYRQIYVTYQVKTDPTKREAYSWDYARKPIERDKWVKNVKNIHTIGITKVLYGNRDDGTNVFTDLSMPFRSMKKARSTIKALNNNLNQMIITNRKRYTKTIDSTTVIFRENKINAQLRKIQQYYTAPLFVETSLDTKIEKDLKQELERAYASSYLYITSEALAPSLDKLITINNTYHKISELFTNVLKIINPTVDNSDFIRISDITTFLRIMNARTEIAAFYLNRFNLWQAEDTQELKDAINEVVSHFNKKGYLINLNENQVKAFFGYMYFNKYSAQFGKELTAKEKQSEIKKYVIDSWTKQHALEQSKANAVKTHLYKIMHSDMNIDEKADKILSILYVDKTEQESHRKDITEFLDMLNTNNYKRLMVSTDRYDTLEALEYDDEYTQASYQYKEATTVLASQQEELNALYEEVKTLIRSTRGLKSALTKKQTNVQYRDDSINTDKPLSYAAIADDSYILILDDIQKQLDELETRKDSITTEQQKRREYLQQKSREFMLNFIQNTNYLTFYKDEVNKRFDQTIKELNNKITNKKKYVDKWKGLWELVQQHVDVYNKTTTKEYILVNKYRTGYSNAAEMLADKDLIVYAICTDMQLDPTDAANIKKVEQLVHSYWNIIDEMDANTSSKLAQAYLDAHPESKSKQKTIKKEIEEASKVLRKLYSAERVKEQYNDRSIFNVKDEIEEEIIAQYLKEFDGLDEDITMQDWMAISDHVDWDVVKATYVYAIKEISKTINKAKKKEKQQTQQRILEDISNVQLSKDSVRSRQRVLTNNINHADKVIAAIYCKWVGNKSTTTYGTSKIIKDTYNRQFNERGGKQYVANKFTLNDKHNELTKSIESTIAKVEHALKPTIDEIEKIQEEIKQSKDIRRKLKEQLTLELTEEQKTDIQNKIKEIDEANAKRTKQIKDKEKLIEPLKKYKYYSEQVLKEITEHINKQKKARKLYEVLDKQPTISNEEYKTLRQEQVIQLTKELLDTDTITDDDLYTLDNILTSDYSYDKDTVYHGIKQELHTVKENINALNAQKETIKSHRNATDKIEGMKQQIKDKQEKINTLIENYKHAKTTHDKYAKNRTNSKLYARYSGLPDTADVVKHVIKRAIEDGLLNDTQQKQIREAGKVDLHNPTIDILLTLYNYAYQQKDAVVNGKVDFTKLPESFIVMDMETVRDLNNTPSPYQISVIKVTIENGVPKTQIATALYNNMAFSDGTVDAPNPLLAQFIDDQTEILRKENPNITDDEIKQHVKEIIDRHKYLKNNVSATNAVINILNQADCPIIAHNGNKFDFPTFDRHMQTYAERLIMNEFNTVLYTLDIDQLSSRAGLAPDLKLDGLPKELQEEFETEWKRRLELTGGMLTNDEAERLTKLADKIARYQINKIVENKYIELLQAKGYIKDPEAYKEIVNDPNSPYNRVISTITKYVYATQDERVSIVNDVYNILKESDPDITGEIVEKLLQSITESATSYRDGSKQVEFTLSNRQKIIQKVLEVLNVPQEQWEQFDYSDRVTALELQIQSITEFIELLKDPKAADNYSKHLQAQQEESKQLEAQRDEIQKQIDEYTDKIKNIETKEKEILEVIAEAYKNIDEITRPSIARANSLLYTSTTIRDNYGSNKIQDRMNTIELLTHELGDAAWTIQFILKAMQSMNTNTDFDKVLVHPALLGIKRSADIQEAKQIIQEEQKRLQKIQERLKQGDYTDLDNIKNNIVRIAKNNLDQALETLKQQVQLMYNKQYDIDIKSALDLFNNVTDKKSLAKAFEQLRELIKNSVSMRNNDDIKTLISLTSSRSLLNKTFTLLKDSEQPIKYDEDLKDLIDVYNTWLDTQIGAHKQTLVLINAVTSTNINREFTSSVKEYLDHALNKFKDTNKSIDTIYTEAIEQSLFKQSGSSRYYGDPEDIEAYSKWEKEQEEQMRKRADETAFTKEIEEVYEVTFVKKDLDKGNDVQGFTLSKDYVWYHDVEPDEVNGETTGHLKIYTIDEVNNQLQSIDIPYEISRDKNNNIIREYKSIDDCYLTLTYNYKQKGHEYQHAQANTLTYKYEEIKKIDRLFEVKSKNNTKTLLPTAYKNLYMPAEDTSQASIRQLYKYIQLITNKRPKDLLKAVDSTAVNIKRAPVDKLANIDVSQKVRDRFVEYLPLLTSLQKDNPRILNPQLLYMNIYNQVMAEYKISSVNPGKYLSLLPEEIEQNLMWYLTDDGIKKFDIDKKYVTEANMGRRYNPKSLYTCDELFGVNTNYVRTLLASSLFRFKYSVLGVVNDLYKDNKHAEDIDFNLAQSLVDYDLDTRIERRKNKLLKDNKNSDAKTIEQINKLAQEQETELYEKRTQLLLSKYTFNGEEYVSNVFTPHVGTITQQENFRKNFYIQGGVNVTVAFADDPRAHEDTILADYDDAMALGATESNKLWLKFGFKGGIKFVKGLRTMYGASFVASRESVIKRGSYGMYMEMVSNKIREFRLGILDTNDPAYKYLNAPEVKEVIEKNIKQYATNEQALADPDCGKMYLVKDKLYVTPDFDEHQFNELLKPLLDKHQGKDYKMLIDAKANSGTFYTINDPITNKELRYDFDESNSDITRGQIYIVFDAEHLAKEAQSLARVTDDDKELAASKLDIRGSVQHGGMVSNTFIQSLAMVIGEYNVEECIIGAEKLDTTERMRSTFKVKLMGTKAVEPYLVYENGKLNVDDSVKNIVDNLTEQYKSVAQLYCNTLKRIEQDGINRDLQLKDINTRFRRVAQASIGTDTGVVYRSVHKRYAAARNQILTNTSLKRGEVRMPIESFEALVNLDKNAWLKEEDVTHEESQNIFNTLKDMTPVEKYEYLLSIGIYEKSKDGYTNFELINPIWETVRGHKRLVYVEDFTFKPVLKRTVAYVLGARSPIQDYKATPVLKIVGLNQHSGMECHPAMYKYMGGDNDGDTAAFIPVKYDEVENGRLSFADSTKLDFYDDGYLQSVSKDLFIDYKDPDNHFIKHVEDPYRTSEIQYAHIGKKSLPDPVANLKDSNGHTDKHYLLVEMLGDAGPKVFDELYQEALKDDAINSINNYLSFDNEIDNKELRWVHAHITHTHSGVSEPNELQGIYNDTQKWKEYYTNNKDEIRKLQIIEHYLRKLFKEGNIEYKQQMVEYARNHTLYRGRVAKALIGVIGGLRKVAYLNTSLSIFPELNKDKSCKLWTKEYGIPEERLDKFTLQDVINSVFVNPDKNNTPIDLSQYKQIVNSVKGLSKEQTINSIKNNLLFNTTRTNSIDIDRIIIYLVERMSELVEVNDRIKDVYNILYKTKEVTYKDIKEVITSKENISEALLYMPVYIEWINNMSDVELNTEVDTGTLTDMRAYYFSRFDKIAEKNEFKVDNKTVDITKYYTDQLLNQRIFTRLQASKLDKAIQIPISESKHGSILPDPVVLEQQLKARAEAIVHELEGRKIYFGNNMEHTRAILMAFEYDIYNRRGINIEQDSEVNTQKSEAAIKRLQSDVIDDPRTVERQLDNAVNNIFIHEVCGGLLTDADWDNKQTKGFVQHFKHLNNVLTHVAKKNNNVLDINKIFTEETQETIDALIKDIEFFQSLGIPSYKLKFGIVNGHAKYLEATKIKKKIDKPSLLQNTLQLYLLCGTDYKELNAKYNTTTASEKQKYFMNYITGKDNPSELLIAVLNEDNEIMKSNLMNEINRVSTRDERFDSYLQDLIDNKTISEETYILLKDKISQPLLQAMNDELLTKINFDAAQKGYTLLESLIKKVADYERTQKTLDLEQKHLKKQIKSDKANALVNQMYQQHLGTHLYKKDSQTIVEYKNKRNRLEQEKQELNKNITKKQHELEKVNKNIKVLEDYQQHIQTKTPDQLIQELENERNTYQTQLNEITNTLVRHAIYEHMGTSLHKLGNNNNPNTPKPIKLTQEVIDEFETDLIMNMDKHQHPFMTLVEAFKRKSNTGDEYVDWDAMYKYLKDHYRFIRITEVIKAGKDEGLARTLIDYISIQDTTMYKDIDGIDKAYNELSKKGKKKYYKQHNKFTELNTFEDLQARFKEAAGASFKLGKGQKKYDALDNDLNIDDFFTPTLKQIRIKSADDLKYIYKKLIEEGDQAPLIGFTYINDILTSIEDAYKPYRVDGFAAKYITKFNIMQKAALRMSAGFLLRNAMDVFLQLSSDMYLERGLTPVLFKPAQVARYLKYGDHIFQAYEFLNDERMFTLIDVLNNYDLYTKETDVNEKQKYAGLVTDYLTRYIEQASAQSKLNSHMTNRLAYAQTLKQDLTDPKKQDKIIERITTFLLNTNFAEYYLFYDNKQINNKTILGLRQDATKEDRNKRLPNKIKRILSEQDDLFKALLIDISAFMQTNAQVDMFKQKQYEELDKIVAQNKFGPAKTFTIDDVREQVQEFRYNTTNKFIAWSKKNIVDLYQNATDYTENMARILGFILNRELYGYSFEESVQRSLKSWFNYGQRTPIEVQMSYDIPYISFPIRSISNWIDRILDPRYARFMDDIIDGIYGQYADEDGQYSEWEQFMIKNGWIPLFNGLGIRAGNGAFDIMNLLSNPSENIKQRYNPILRGLSEFIESGDLTKAAKQLASFGVMNRVANAVAPRALNQVTGIGSTEPKTLGNSSTAFFEYNEDDYDKYIPYRYRYPNNGRYKYYENIYRDWFNKYGRMRKPTKDPVTLVNNIQWQQYLRYKRNQYRR